MEFCKSCQRHWSQLVDLTPAPLLSPAIILIFLAVNLWMLIPVGRS